MTAGNKCRQHRRLDKALTMTDLSGTGESSSAIERPAPQGTSQGQRGSAGVRLLSQCMSVWRASLFSWPNNDQNNAAYWYARASKPGCREPLDEEWLSTVRELLE